MIYVHHLNPVIATIGGWQLHYYGLMYALAFFCGYLFLHVAARRGQTALSAEQLENLTLAVAAGVVLGGRIGHFLFYAPADLVRDPLEFLRVWHGGMSFHGGLLGVAVVLVILAKKWRMPLLKLADLVAVPAALGLVFGRLGNWINGELPGRLTDGSWGVIFPNTDGLPRHPAQLYAAAKDLFLTAILYVVWQKRATQKLPDGTVAFTFLTFYGLFRFMVEFWREPLDGYFGPLTAGQVYSLPVFFGGVLGLYFLWRRRFF